MGGNPRLKYYIQYLSTTNLSTYICYSDIPSYLVCVDLGDKRDEFFYGTCTLIYNLWPLS